MLYKLCNIDAKSKKWGFGVAIFNLVLTLVLNALIVTYWKLSYNYYDLHTALHLERLSWAEVALNFIFMPFDVYLAIGVKRHKYMWIRSWVIAKIVQASCILLLNSVVMFYIVRDVTFKTDLIIIFYTIIVEVAYLESIVFMEGYHQKWEKALRASRHNNNVENHH